MKKLLSMLACLTFLFPALVWAEAEQMTPVTARVLALPLDYAFGSDGEYHLVYEIEFVNISDKTWTVERVKAIAGDRVLGDITGPELKSRIGFLDKRGGNPVLGPQQSSVLWMHLKFKSKADLPKDFQHQVTLTGAPQPFVMTVAEAAVSPDQPIAISPPLKGDNWFAADGCCDSVRHVRALLPVDGALVTSQRFAIDWERLNGERRIVTGDVKNPENYVCYGQEIHAVADAEVVEAVDQYQNQIPGKLPDKISLAEADGNHVILKLDASHYALYAHMKPGSVRVKKGDHVTTGQVIGLIGNTGNTSEPHMHFHIMDGPSSLGSNGLPYVLKSFTLQGHGRATAEFDKAAAEGTVLAIEAVKGPAERQNALPLDLSLVTLP